MSRRSGSSKGSRNSKKTEGSDRSNKIDLDKDPDLNLDKPDDIELDDKESGGNFGELSTELGLWEDEESGQSVSAVAGVDVVPLGVSISANGDIGSVGVDIGLPGDVIGVSANLQIDLETGDIIGGGGAIDYGGVSVGVDQIRKDGETCTTITVTYFGVGASYQRCKKDDDDDEKDPKKDPPPGSEDETPLPDPPLTQIPGDQNRYCSAIIGRNNQSKIIAKKTGACSGYIAKINELMTMSVAFSETESELIGMAFNSEVRNDEVFPDRSFSFQASGYFSFASLTWSNPGVFFDLQEGTVARINQILRDRTYRLDGTNIIEGADGCNEFSLFSATNWVTVSVFFPDTGEIITPPPEEPEKPPEPPNPPIPPEDPMTCCDLEPVMSLLRKVSTAVGTDQLPANMPKSFLKNEGTRKIPSLAELQVYQIEVIDQLIGKFPIELEILDTDPLTPGDQTKKVVLQNLAESIAELFGLAINSSHDNAIQTSGVIKNLLEITLVRQAVLQNYYRLDAILDYLGAGLEEDEASFNSTISLPKDPNNISEDVADFLQNSEIKFAYDKLANPKDTLTAKLLPIQKAADIIKAKYWKGFGKAGGDYTGAIKKWLETYDPKNEQNETDWKDKIDKILEEYAKDQAGNIDKDRMPEIQNIKQIGSEPAPEPEAKK